MKRLELKKYNGQFNNRGVVARIRRKIESRARQGECVLVDGENVVGLTPIDLQTILGGLPSEKVRAVGFPSLRPFPVPVAQIETSNG